MTEFLEHMQGKDMIGLMAVVVGLGGCIVLSGWKHWLKHRVKEINAELKRDMIAAGMSAEEIVRVLEAGDLPKNGKNR